MEAPQAYHLKLNQDNIIYKLISDALFASYVKVTG